MTRTQVAKYWPVITGVAVGVGWLVTGSVQLGEIKSNNKHSHEKAAVERSQLISEDVRLNKRIDKTDNKLNRLKTKTESMNETVIKIEIGQKQVIKNQQRILNKLEGR